MYLKIILLLIFPLFVQGQYFDFGSPLSFKENHIKKSATRKLVHVDSNYYYFFFDNGSWISKADNPKLKFNRRILVFNKKDLSLEREIMIS